MRGGYLVDSGVLCSACSLRTTIHRKEVYVHSIFCLSISYFLWKSTLYVNNVLDQNGRGKNTSIWSAATDM